MSAEQKCFADPVSRVAQPCVSPQCSPRRFSNFAPSPSSLPALSACGREGTRDQYIVERTVLTRPVTQPPKPQPHTSNAAVRTAPTVKHKLAHWQTQTNSRIVILVRFPRKETKKTQQVKDMSACVYVGRLYNPTDIDLI